MDRTVKMVRLWLYKVRNGICKSFSDSALLKSINKAGKIYQYQRVFKYNIF